jgi:hypothetical protein
MNFVIYDLNKALGYPAHQIQNVARMREIKRSIQKLSRGEDGGLLKQTSENVRLWTGFNSLRTGFRSNLL